LIVELDDDGAGVVAKLLLPEGIDAFGSGSTIHAALTDLVEVMRGEVSSLRDRRDRLSAALLKELGFLDRVLASEAKGPSLSPSYVGARFPEGTTGPAFKTAPTRNSYIPSSAAELTV